MTVEHLIKQALDDVNKQSKELRNCLVLSNRCLEPPYPAGYRLAIVYHCDGQEPSSSRFGISLWRCSASEDSRHFYKQTATADPNEIPAAVYALFQQFNDECWTPEDLLNAWKDMPYQNYRSSDSPIGIPYLHFNENDTWQAVLDWFGDKAKKHGQSIIKRTLYLENSVVRKHQRLMADTIDYDACGIDADSWVACWAVPFGDLWTVEYRICAGDRDTPLRSEAVLLFDEHPVLGVTNLDERSVLSKWELTAPGNLVRFVLEVREKPDAYTGYFHGKTEEGKWVSGYLREYPGERQGEAAFFIQNFGVNFVNSTMTSKVRSDSISPYIGLMDSKGKLIFGNSVLRHPVTGQRFTPFWLKKSCGWVLLRDDKDGGSFFAMDDPVFWVDNDSEDHINLEVIGNTFDDPTY